MMIKRMWDVITGKAARMERDAIVEEMGKLEARVAAIEATLEEADNAQVERTERRGSEWDVLG